MAKAMGFEVQDQALLMFQECKKIGQGKVNADGVILQFGLVAMPTWEESRAVWIEAAKKCMKKGIDVVEFISWVMNDTKMTFKRYWTTVAKWILNDYTFIRWVKQNIKTLRIDLEIKKFLKKKEEMALGIAVYSDVFFHKFDKFQKRPSVFSRSEEMEFEDDD